MIWAKPSGQGSYYHKLPGCIMHYEPAWLYSACNFFIHTSNKNIFEFKNMQYRDGINSIGDKTGIVCDAYLGVNLFGSQDRVTKLGGYSYEQALSRCVQIYIMYVD